VIPIAPRKEEIPTPLQSSGMPGPSSRFPCGPEVINQIVIALANSAERISCDYAQIGMFNLDDASWHLVNVLLTSSFEGDSEQCLDALVPINA
jgi:hypothetical protein